MAIITDIKQKLQQLRARKRARDFVLYLQQDKHLPVTEAYLFGSYATGQQKKWSDIDVCVVSPYFTSDDDAISFLWQQLRPIDSWNGLEPIGFNEESFRDDFPLIREIKQKGLRIL